MPNQFTDQKSPSLQGTPSGGPQGLPHGFIGPPEWVRETVARERSKFPPGIFTPEAEERLTNDLTLQHYFDGLGYEVAYRSTPRGPDVLAVGYDEILALTRGMSLEERSAIKTWLP
jgi:hypothetical protein